MPTANVNAGTLKVRGFALVDEIFWSTLLRNTDHEYDIDWAVAHDENEAAASICTALEAVTYNTLDPRMLSIGIFGLPTIAILADAEFAEPRKLRAVKLITKE